MHVDVHLGRIEVDVQNTARKFLGRQVGHIGLLQGRTSRFALDKTIVDKKVLVIAIGLDVVRSTDKAVYADTLVFPIHLNQPSGKIPSEHGIDGAFELPVSRRFQLGHTVADQAHGNLGMGQSHPLHVGGHGHGFGHVPLQELAAGRHVGKQIFHDHGGTHLTAPFGHAKHATALDLKHSPHVLLFSAGHDPHIRHRGNGRQGLSAKA